MVDKQNFFNTLRKKLGKKLRLFLATIGSSFSLNFGSIKYTKSEKPNYDLIVMKEGKQVFEFPIVDSDSLFRLKFAEETVTITFKLEKNVIQNKKESSVIKQEKVAPKKKTDAEILKEYQTLRDRRFKRQLELSPQFMEKRRFEKQVAWLQKLKKKNIVRSIKLSKDSLFEPLKDDIEIPSLKKTWREEQFERFLLSYPELDDALRDDD
jgi:hypothetical protein